MTCRQIPHGGVGSSASVAITIASKLRFPLVTAADKAFRSAQIPAGNEAFSTLQPSVTLPSVASTAAPTRNFEYGAYARSIAAKARSRKSVTVLESTGRSAPNGLSEVIP